MPQLSTNANQATSIQVVESLFDAFRANDLERAFGLFHDDIVYHNPPFPPDRGRAQAERTLKLFSQLGSEFDIKLHNIAERGNIVLTERTDSVRGRFAHVDFWVCGTFEVRNGKIVLWRDHFDIGELLIKLATSPLRKLLDARRS
ncbi:MAG: limonene-1,2-epoxide hydrolase family protein [Polyangiales bacterium]